MVLGVVLSVSCVSAQDNMTVSDNVIEKAVPDVIDTSGDLENSSDVQGNDSQGGDANDSSQSPVNESHETENDSSALQENIDVVFKTSDSNIIKGKYFSLTVTDENGTAISNKPVYFTINGVTTAVNTTSKGVAKLLINEKVGSYTVKYTLNETGYNYKTGSTKILVISSSKSVLKSSAYTAYYGFKNQVVVTLTAGGVNLANRVVKMKINKKTYSTKTNSKGKAYFAIGLKIGKYTAKYTYGGEKNIKSSSTSAVVTVKKMTTHFKKANSVIYRDKTSGKLKVKLLDARGNPVKNKNVKITYNKKTYNKKTDANGMITVSFKLSKGAYKFKYSFAKTSLYQKTSKTYTVKVKSKAVKNNGIWLLSTDMKKVDFKYFKKIGMKHIFLNVKAIERYGKSSVESFIAEGNDNGIKTHLWMQVFYNSGKWVYPVKNGKIKYDMINKKVKEAKSYAKIKGVSGIHFDYLRFPGNAYKYKNAAKAVNYFTKKASNEVHKINSGLIVSAAVMPEPSSMKYYYAQDIPTISKYLDVIVPMVYKGNYKAGTSWIQSVTHSFVKMSKGAQIWTGLQTYQSDSNVKKLSSSTLINDADYAGFGGAKGVIMFRYGLLNFFNFSEV